MKNLLKNKKVVIGGGIVLALGLIGYYYNKGKKVLNSTSKNSYSNADGSLLFAENSNNKINSFSNHFLAGGSNVTTSRNLTDSAIGNPQLEQAVARLGALNQSIAELQMVQSSNAVATPIVTNQGIIVKPSGDLQPVGISGFFTTLQAGFTGAPSVALINDIKTKTQAIVQSKEENLKK